MREKKRDIGVKCVKSLFIYETKKMSRLMIYFKKSERFKVGSENYSFTHKSDI
jgi:hypothetical protein